MVGCPSDQPAILLSYVTLCNICLFHNCAIVQKVFQPEPEVTPIMCGEFKVNKDILHFTLHYITLSAFQTPPTPKVTSGASTITCYTKYSPPAQHSG